MAEVVLDIGGRSYTIACRDGGEAHLRTLATRVDAKVEEARAAVGTASEVRQLLFASLLLADETQDAVTSPSVAISNDDTELARNLSALAARIETVADALEPNGAKH